MLSVSVSAAPNLKNENYQQQVFQNQKAINHILFKLEILDITDLNLSNLNLTKLKYENEADQDFNLIKREELLGVFGDNFGMNLEAVREEETEELVLSPRIIVSPGHTAVMRVAEEEIFLDLADIESIDSITYTNIFELEISPRNAFDQQGNPVITTLNLKTGQGPTGLKTEIAFKPNKFYLLAVMESSKTKKVKGLTGGSSETEKRYFAIFLKAKPAGVLTLPELSSSLAGLEDIFAEPELRKKEANILLKYGYQKDDNHKLSLAGSYQNDSKLKIDFTINEILTERNTISLLGNIYESLWLGVEISYLGNDETELALKFNDLVKIAALKLEAGFNPFVYNFETESEDISWYLRAETDFSQNLNFALEYKSLVEADFAEFNFVYDLNNYSFLLGYSWNLDLETEDAYWLGVQYNF